MHSKLSRFVPIVAGIGLTSFILGGSYSVYKGYKKGVNKSIQKTVEYYNSRLPVTVEEGLDLVAVDMKDKNVYYEYRLTDIDKQDDQLIIKGLMKDFEDKALEKTKSAKELVMLRDRNMNFIHIFKDRDNENLNTIKITPEKYKD